MAATRFGSSARVLTWLILSLVLPPPGEVPKPPVQTPGQVSAGSEIPSPASWVPFHAEFRQVRTDGGVETGRFHGDAAGSTRLVIETASEAAIASPVITIVNIPQKVLYLCSKRGVWSARAMRLSVHSSQPRRMRADTPGLTRLAEPFEGLGAYRLDAGRGPVEIVVPDLNFFAVRKEWRAGPRALTEYRRIVVGEQPADLFTPPPGVQVQRLVERGSIEIELEVGSTGGRRDRVLTNEGKPSGAIAFASGQRYSFETRLMDDQRFVVGVKVYSPLPAAADGTQRTLVEELEIEAWRPVVTTSTDPLLEIRVSMVGGRTYSLLKPGIY